MQRLAPLLLLATLLPFAAPARAAVVWDESVNGDLSSVATAPTALSFALGSNVVIGTVFNSQVPTGDRDFITFVVPPNAKLTELNLLTWSPDNLGFTAFNAGATSFVPSASTNASFLAGIHVSSSLVGTNLMPLYVTSSVTTHALAFPYLDPGTYSFVVQQTSPIVDAYAFEFVLEAPVPAQPTSWGAIQRLYR